ncbi:hypothetical protein pW2_30 [Bacillus phage pW2]|uniref:dUTP diphosphatase n=1 Tax=Bacillus phage pW2 TaxID=2500559 RepID=A0A3Q9R7G4_9CAUD|nr:dUTPase [Bacillus phage pW2]AZU98869.1 hypothetical protein pW2_30 [Bacillus phage pW2]
MTNINKKTKKRFYRESEIIWIHGDKVEGKVVSLDIPNQNVVVEVNGEEKTLKLWEIDKLKYRAKDKFFKENPDKIKKKTQKYNPVIAKGELMLDSNPKVQLMLPVVDPKAEMNNFSNLVSLSKALEEMNKRINAIMNPEVFFAKIHPDAITPTKRDEDAGYDLYACVDSKEVGVWGKGYGTEQAHVIYCPANETTLVPTGLAFALPKTHYLNAKHERGSTGKISMSVLAGVIDSGYRGEVFLAITPLHKDVIITSQVEKTLDLDDRIYYPYSKAIAQATVDLVPNTKLTELTLEELVKIESERGDTKLGQSGK